MKFNTLGTLLKNKKTGHHIGFARPNVSFTFTPIQHSVTDTNYRQITEMKKPELKPGV